MAFAAHACGVPPPPHAPWPVDIVDVAALKTTRDMTAGNVCTAPQTVISAGFRGPQGVCSQRVRRVLADAQLEGGERRSLTVAQNKAT